MPSSLAALGAEQNPLRLPPVDGVVIMLVDGLGALSLAARAGHARTLAPLLTGARGPTTIASPFPTTTASALATLTTGVASGVHGMVGYTVLDPANDRVVNELSGWDDRLDPATWQRMPTLFERAASDGVRSFAIGPERYRDSGFSSAVLRGAEYLAGADLAERFAQARAALDTSEKALVYLYAPELDQAGHSSGWESAEWTEALEALDGQVRDFASILGKGALGKRVGMLLTSDHGMLDVPESSHILYDADPGLMDGIRHVAGEPRALQLHFEPDASLEHRERVLRRWREAEGGRSWIVSRAEAIDSGWFGPRVEAEVAPRIGDIVIATRKAVAYYPGPGDSQVRPNHMIGQHGSWSPEESTVPLLRFGAFAG